MLIVQIYIPIKLNTMLLMLTCNEILYLTNNTLMYAGTTKHWYHDKTLIVILSLGMFLRICWDF